jgi:hypothetical protein
MSAIDFKKLIGEAASRHGILLREDDPALVIVTLNHLILQSATNELIQKIRLLAVEFSEAAERVQERAGAAIGDEVRAAVDSARAGLKGDVEAERLQVRKLITEVHQAHSRPTVIRWITVGVLAATGLLGCGVLLGNLMR